MYNWNNEKNKPSAFLKDKMALCHSFPIQHSLGTRKMETQQVMTSIQAVFFLLILEIGQIDTTAACH